MTIAMPILRPGSLCLAALLMSVSACTKDDNKGGGGDPPPPPPPASASSGKPGACANGGGELTDAVSAAYLPKKVSSYCVDPQGEIKTYGEKGKSSMDEVCTTAFDGECEVYKKFGLKRVVSLHYVDGSGGSGTVEVNVSSFADAAGAYGMFTLRVVAGDPADPSTPKPFTAGAAGAIGTGRAYVWRGVHLVELQYNNEQEAPDALAKSSDSILRAVGAEIGSKLPGPTTLPPAAAALPEGSRVANGIVFQPKDVMGFTGVGPGAIGFYKDGDRRWRTLAVFKDDADQAKDAFKTIKSRPGTLPITGIGDEAGARRHRTARRECDEDGVSDRTEGQSDLGRGGRGVRAARQGRRRQGAPHEGRGDREAEGGARSPGSSGGVGLFFCFAFGIGVGRAEEVGVPSAVRSKHAECTFRVLRTSVVAAMKRVVTGSW